MATKKLQFEFKNGLNFGSIHFTENHLAMARIADTNNEVPEIWIGRELYPMALNQSQTLDIMPILCFFLENGRVPRTPQEITEANNKLRAKYPELFPAKKKKDRHKFSKTFRKYRNKVGEQAEQLENTLQALSVASIADAVEEANAADIEKVYRPDSNKIPEGEAVEMTVIEETFDAAKIVEKYSTVSEQEMSNDNGV